MNTDDDTLRRLAREAADRLRRIKVGEAERVVIRDGAPSWVQPLCHHAHGDMMPDDWRFEFIQDALNALADGADDDGIDLDALYPYTADRLAWLASRLDRAGYCDQAAEESGSAPPSVLDAVAWGMAAELREVYDLVRARLEELAGEGIDGDQDGG